MYFLLRIADLWPLCSTPRVRKTLSERLTILWRRLGAHIVRRRSQSTHRNGGTQFESISQDILPESGVAYLRIASTEQACVHSESESDRNQVTLDALSSADDVEIW